MSSEANHITENETDSTVSHSLMNKLGLAQSQSDYDIVMH